jgi:hypothetical protein
MAMYPATSMTPAPRKQRPFRLFLPLALPFAVLIGVGVFGALTPFKHDAGPPPGAPGALVWGNGIFANSFELKAWLKLHGASYPAWAKQHPAAVRLVKPRPVKRARHGAAVPVRPAKRASAAVAAPVATAGRSHSAHTWLFVLVGLLAIAGALLPHRLLGRIGPGRVPELRLGIAGTGLALLVGVGVTLLLG